MASGLWSGNPALVQLLGLCPLLAVSTTLAYGSALGVATLFTLVTTNVLVSVLRPLTPDHARIPVFVMVIASLVTVVELTMAAWFAELHAALGLFVPLIVTNCTILGRAEACAYRTSPGRAAIDGVSHGLGFLLALVALGGVREALGHGTLFRDFDQLIPGASDMTITLVTQGPLAIALLPPGAFFGLAILVAGHRWLRTSNEPG